MRPLALGKIRGFGGKLGEELAALGCSTAGEVRARSAVPGARQCPGVDSAWGKLLFLFGMKLLSLC